MRRYHNFVYCGYTSHSWRTQRISYGIHNGNLAGPRKQYKNYVHGSWARSFAIFFVVSTPCGSRPFIQNVWRAMCAPKRATVWRWGTGAKTPTCIANNFRDLGGWFARDNSWLLSRSNNQDSSREQFKITINLKFDKTRRTKPVCYCSRILIFYYQSVPIWMAEKIWKSNRF